ncbi:transcription initiation factor IIF, beta subunit-domain-containing protein [Lipomyces oligophaga]|uniref:transcription initiation factor IIF, beta subunit-domain-containing protein n=1 Tax=Lipomyces oligophaga TaxID=45792 RepID=UPI0034CFB500
MSSVESEIVKQEADIDVTNVNSELGYEDDEDGGVSPASIADEEPVFQREEGIYEDSGDLDMSSAHKSMWLVRMPKFLRDKWLDMQETGENLGRIVTGQNSAKLILADSPAVADLPHEYNLEVRNKSVSNTYVFTEQNLDRFGSQQNNGQQLQSGPERRGGRRRYMPYVKVNIPKRTTLVGTVQYDCSLTVSPNDANYHNLVALRQRMTETAPRPTVTLLDEIPGVTSARAGPSMREVGSNFMKSQKREKERVQEGKAARIPRNELYDLLFKLFEEYDYWGMRGLRERTHQPEAYLKEVLDNVAVLNKKGPYASKYSLKPTYKGKKLQDVSSLTGPDASSLPGSSELTGTVTEDES